MNELRINNTFYPHKPYYKFTFKNTRGKKSTVDYTITNRNIHPTKILDARVLMSANTGNNYNLILAKIWKYTLFIKIKQMRKTIEKLNIVLLSDKSIRDV